MPSRFGPQPSLPVGVLNAYSDLVDVEPWIFGFNPAVNAQQGVWSQSSTFNFPAAAGTACNITSTSANDTNAAGTGARTVFVAGLDVNFNLVTVTAALAGAGLVAIGTFRRILFSQCMTFGALGWNDGTVTVQSAAPVVFDRIRNEYNRSDAARWTCPANGTFFCTGWGGSVGLETLDPLTVDIEKRFFLYGGFNQFTGARMANNAVMDIWTTGQNTSFYRPFSSPRRIQPGSDIFVNCQAVSGAPARVSAYINVERDIP